MKHLNRMLGFVLMNAAVEGATGGAAAPAVPGAAPAVPKAPTKKELAAQAKADKAAAKAKADADKAAAAPAEKPKAIEQNGVTRPASGKTKLVWDIADQMSATAKAPIDRKALTDVLLAAPHNLVVGTIHTQYGKWRKFHGLVAAKAEAAPAAPAVPETPAAAPAAA